MLDYLVTSSTRRGLLGALWGEKAEGTPSELAARTGASFAGVHAELQRMLAAGLATCRRVGNATLYAANLDHPAAGALTQLIELDSQLGPAAPSGSEKREASLRAWLEQLGAPLLHRGRPPSPMPPVEEVLADALTLCHTDPTLTRVMPVCLWKNLSRLNMDHLVGLARARNEHQTLGFLLDVTAKLGKDRKLGEFARSLKDGRIKTMRRFFAGRASRYTQKLEAANTPPVAKRWHFWMNMGLDSFETAFDKHVGHA